MSIHIHDLIQASVQMCIVQRIIVLHCRDFNKRTIHRKRCLVQVNVANKIPP